MNRAAAKANPAMHRVEGRPVGSFHAAFAQALLSRGEVDDPLVRALAAQPAFAVYRNTVMKGCVDALEANFPAVARLVGSEWFRAAAAAYAATEPPVDGRLLVYGDAGFATFLQQLPTTATLPYLAGVAHLDTLWRAVHAASDAPVLQAQALAELPAQALPALVLRPHPATQWAWFDAQPVATIWSRNRGEAGDLDDIPWEGEGLLLTRRDGAVHWQAFPRAGCAFLDACAEGHTLGAAAQRCLSLAQETELALLLQQLLQAGAFMAGPSPTKGLPA